MNEFDKSKSLSNVFDSGISSASAVKLAGDAVGISGNSKNSDDSNSGTVKITSDIKTDAKADGSFENSVDLMFDNRQKVKEDNGIFTIHIPHKQSKAYADASSTFTGATGFSDMEWPFVMKHGPEALSSDANSEAGLKHGDSNFLQGDKDELLKVPKVFSFNTNINANTNTDSSAKTISDILGSIKSGDVSYDCINEKPTCIDESGIERYYGDSWVYKSDACKICACTDKSKVECHEKQCDPYPDCPEDHFVVEENVDSCCVSYRIVKNNCEIKKCEQPSKTCGVHEVMISYAIDDCCATFMCQCDIASCFKFSGKACPTGSVRIKTDDTCCGVGKCISTSSSVFASAGLSANDVYKMFGGNNNYGGKSSFRADLSGNQKAGSLANSMTDHSVSLTIPQVAHEANLCIDENGIDRKFGEQWLTVTNGCQHCTCVDQDKISCSSQNCDQRPEPQHGMKIVEEKTSDCCVTYRVIKENCNEKLCEFKPIQCSPFQKLVTYKIDDCCSTYECVCAESLCATLGNPSCPPGSVRVVLEQDACCPVPKCAFNNRLEASVAALTHAAHQQTVVMLPENGIGSKKTDDLLFGSNVYTKPKAGSIAENDIDNLLTDTFGSGRREGNTLVTSFISGKTKIGSSALADLNQELGKFSGFYGPEILGEYPSGITTSAGATSKAGKPLTVLETLGKDEKIERGLSFEKNYQLGIGSNSDATAAGSQNLSGKFGGFDVASEAAICTDNVGKERCYGEQWLSDTCKLCTCVGVDQVSCVTKTCEPVPVPSNGEKVVEEKSDNCCTSYRVVQENCDVSQCQLEAPRCQACEVLQIYSLDKCCATYECVCNKNMCAQLNKLPCSKGYERKIIEPEACCPVEKCVSTGNAIANAFGSLDAPEISILLQGSRDLGSYGGSGLLKNMLASETSAKGTATGSNSGLYNLKSLELSKELKEFCVDESGRSRCYGETWYKSGDACNVCSCTSKNTVDCRTQKCESYPNTPNGYKIVQEKADDCCFSYKTVPEDCDIKNCAEKAPVCSFYEDLVRYTVDKCCSTYECACNPSKCFQLGFAACPIGMELVDADNSACCKIKKCVKTSISSALASSGALIKNGYVDTLRSENNKHSTDITFDVDAKTKPVSSSSTDSQGKISADFQIISEACICTDSIGKQRSYGDTWTVGCKVCTCADIDKIRLLFFLCTLKNVLI